MYTPDAICRHSDAEMYYDEYDQTSPPGVTTPNYTSAAAAAFSAGGNDRTKATYREPIIRGSMPSDTASSERSLDRKLASSGAVKLMLPGKYSISRRSDNDSTVFDALPGSKAGVGEVELPAADAAVTGGGKQRALPKALMPRDARRVVQPPLPSRVTAMASTQQPRRSSISGYTQHSAHQLASLSSSLRPESPAVLSSVDFGSLRKSSISSAPERQYRSASIFGDTVVSSSWGSRPEVDFTRRRDSSSGRRFVESEPNAGMLMLRQQKADREATSTGVDHADDETEVFVPTPTVLRRTAVGPETTSAATAPPRTTASSTRRLSFADSLSFFASTDEGGQRQKVLPPRPSFVPKPVKYLHFNTLDGDPADTTDAGRPTGREEFVPAFMRRVSQPAIVTRSIDVIKSETADRQSRRGRFEKEVDSSRREDSVLSEKTQGGDVRPDSTQTETISSTLDIALDKTRVNRIVTDQPTSTAVKLSSADVVVRQGRSPPTEENVKQLSNGNTSDVIDPSPSRTRDSVALPAARTQKVEVERQLSVSGDVRGTDDEDNTSSGVSLTNGFELDNCNGAPNENQAESREQSASPLPPPTLQTSPAAIPLSDPGLSTPQSSPTFGTLPTSIYRSPSPPTLTHPSPTDDDESPPPPLPVSLPPPLSMGSVSSTSDATVERDRYIINDDDEEIASGAPWTGNGSSGGNTSTSGIMGWYWRTQATPGGGLVTHHRPTDSTATVDSGHGSVSGYSGQMSDGHDDNALSSADELDAVDCVRRRSPSATGSLRPDRFCGSPSSIATDAVRQNGTEDCSSYAVSPPPSHHTTDSLLSPTTSDVMTTDSDLDDCGGERQYLRHECTPNSPEVISTPDDGVTSTDAVAHTVPDVVVPASPPHDILNQLLAENGTTLVDLEHWMLSSSAPPTGEQFQTSQTDAPTSGIACVETGTPRYVNNQHGGGHVTNTETEERRTTSALVDIRPLEVTSDKYGQKSSSLEVIEDGKRRMEITVIKGALGLGFCIQGGVGSAAGDQPISVKRLFRTGDKSGLGDLKAGDEILAVNGVPYSSLSHYEAWNRLKSLSDGPFVIAIARTLND